MNMTDPWLTNNEEKSNAISDNSVEEKLSIEVKNNQLEFEDNFAPSAAAAAKNSQSGGVEPSIGRLQPLPDSETYLHGLERKLSKIKEKTNLVQALAQKREDCMRTLLQTENIFGGSISASNDDILELETPVHNIEVYRQLQPIQPVTVGETVRIVRYDQLDQDRKEAELEVEEKANADKEERASR